MMNANSYAILASVPAMREHSTLDKITKMMIVYELHGLNDIAANSVERFRAELSPRLDADAQFNLSPIRTAEKRLHDVLVTGYCGSRIGQRISLSALADVH